MKVFVITLFMATSLMILCAICLGIGRLITGRSTFTCKRCGNPEEKEGCSMCKKKKKP